MGKGLLIIILGSMMLLTFVSMSFVKSSNSGIENAFNHYDDVHARNIGNSMVNILLTRLAEDFEYRENGGEEEFLGGTMEYKLIDTVFERQTATWTGPPGQKDKGKDKFKDNWTYAVVGVDTVIKIEVHISSIYGKEVDKTIRSFTRQNRAGGWVPPVVRGAWTANGDLNKTISDMYIDGRDHDLSLNLIPKTGTRAVSTSVDFTNDENAAIGGTKDSIDYALQYPENANTIEENYVWGGTFPETPDEILGYPEGTLKKLAQSGEMGSQYVLNPSKDIEDDLTFPLAGVTFIELTDGVERELIMDGSGGKQNGGVLVIHGPNRSARIKGLKLDDGIKASKIKDGDPILFCHLPGDPDQESRSTADPDTLDAHLGHGDMLDNCAEVMDARFTGLIVTDYSFHHHLDILGAMLNLSPDLEMSKNCNGNKDHWVKYSQEAVRAATEVTAVLSREIGNSDVRVFDVGGFGAGRQKSSYYFE